MSEPLWLYCEAHKEATYLGNSWSGKTHPSVSDAISHVHSSGHAAAVSFQASHAACELGAWSGWSDDLAPFARQLSPAKWDRAYRQDWRFYTFGGNMPMAWIEESQKAQGRQAGHPPRTGRDRRWR